MDRCWYKNSIYVMTYQNGAVLGVAHGLIILSLTFIQKLFVFRSISANHGFWKIHCTGKMRVHLTVRLFSGYSKRLWPRWFWQNPSYIFGELSFDKLPKMKHVQNWKGKIFIIHHFAVTSKLTRLVNIVVLSRPQGMERFYKPGKEEISTSSFNIGRATKCINI